MPQNPVLFIKSPILQTLDAGINATRHSDRYWAARRWWRGRRSWQPLNPEPQTKVAVLKTCGWATRLPRNRGFGRSVGSSHSYWSTCAWGPGRHKHKTRAQNPKLHATLRFCGATGLAQYSSLPCTPLSSSENCTPLSCHIILHWKRSVKPFNS